MFNNPSVVTHHAYYEPTYDFIIIPKALLQNNNPSAKWAQFRYYINATWEDYEGKKSNRENNPGGDIG